MHKIKIALIEDQSLFREGLEAMLKLVDDFEIVCTAANGKDFLNLVSLLPVPPDVILLDMNMPEMNGLELTEILQKQYPSIKIIILTVYNQERFIGKMIEAGVAGYLIKNCDIEEVITAIRSAYKSGFYFNDAALKAMRNASKFKSTPLRSLANIPIDLTDREIEILKLICQEFTNAEIADKLFLSSRTIDGHRNHLLAKTGCKNTAGLVLFAVNNGLHETMLF